MLESRRDQAGRGGVAGRVAPLPRRRARDPLGPLSAPARAARRAGGADADRRPRLRARSRRPTTIDRAAAALGEAAELAATFGVRLALEFQKSSPVCACLETALALIEQSGAANAGVCLDVFHYYTGPSKFEDLAYLSPQNLAWVQVCDLSGTPRELAGDGDRILPGEGDFQLGPIVEHLGRIGYDGHVSLEVLNPHLWQVAADRVADLGHQALCRVLGRWEVGPRRNSEEDHERVVGGDPPTRGGRVPRGAILRLAGLRPDRAAGSAHRTGLGPRTRLVARVRAGPGHRLGLLDVR